MEKQKPEEEVYTIKKDVRCLKRSSKGAVQYYGQHYPKGMGETTLTSYKEYENKPYLSPAMGFGGTIPYECLNCGNQGLIDFGGLEGYEQAFESVPANTAK